MIINQAIRAVQREEGITGRELAQRVGKTPPFVSSMFHRNDLMVSTACNFAEALGYEIVIRKEGEKDGIVITTE